MFEILFGTEATLTPSMGHHRRDEIIEALFSRKSKKKVFLVFIRTRDYVLFVALGISRAYPVKLKIEES